MSLGQTTLYNIDDPVDIIRYWISFNWKVTNFSPMPEIKAMHSKPSIRLTDTKKNFVRPYWVSDIPRYIDKYGHFKETTFNITVDIQCFTDEVLGECIKETKRALAQNRNSPNPAGEDIYRIIELNPDTNLSRGRSRLFGESVELQFITKFSPTLTS
ncbi:MAG: hypothetical protein V3U54_12985 [Thermodesulfobacteriota bacterium]